MKSIPKMDGFFFIITSIFSQKACCCSFLPEFCNSHALLQKTVPLRLPICFQLFAEIAKSHPSQSLLHVHFH